MKMSYSIVYIQSINEVISELLANNVPLIHNACLDGWQIRFPWCKGDVASNSLTCDSKYGWVETSNFPWDEENGYSVLTPKRAIKDITKLYLKMKDE